MNSVDHFGFILAAYSVGLIVIGGMIVLTIADYASLKKRLAQLTARAGTRSDNV